VGQGRGVVVVVRVGGTGWGGVGGGLEECPDDCESSRQVGRMVTRRVGNSSHSRVCVQVIQLQTRWARAKGPTRVKLY
jgi:hypothetical protein